MNHALIGPLRIVIQISTRPTIHQISSATSAAGTTPGTAFSARVRDAIEGSCRHSAIAPAAVRPAIDKASAASTADAISAQIVDSEIGRAHV